MPPGKTPSRRKPRRPTLSDVAREAGVSLGTASHVFSRPQVARASTIEKVRRAAEKLDYVPHGAARALASRRTRLIGIVLPTLTNPAFAAMVQSLQTHLTSRGYHLIVVTDRYEPDTEVDVVRALLEHGVDGIVMVGIDHAESTFALLKARRVPYVLTWAQDRSGIHHCIGFDYRDSVRRITQHLVDAGHRNFAMLIRSSPSLEPVKTRVRTVRSVLRAHGIDLPVTHLIEQPHSIEGGRLGLRLALALSPRPTALMCSLDIAAIGAILEAQRQGLRVPQDLAITGHDDIEQAALIPPGLTTMAVPSAEIGQLAAERIAALIGKAQPPANIRVPVSLVVRGSSDAAKRR